jgi:hypothetical protein
MNDKVMRMAREAGIADAFLVTPHPGVVQQLERFAALIRADEREACAKVCEDSVEYAGDTLAEAIRARGNK